MPPQPESIRKRPPFEIKPKKASCKPLWLVSRTCEKLQGVNTVTDNSPTGYKVCERSRKKRERKREEKEERAGPRETKKISRLNRSTRE